MKRPITTSFMITMIPAMFLDSEIPFTRMLVTSKIIKIAGTLTEKGINPSKCGM